MCHHLARRSQRDSVTCLTLLPAASLCTPVAEFCLANFWKEKSFQLRTPCGHSPELHLYLTSSANGYLIFFYIFLHFPNIIVASVFKVWVAWWPGRLPAIPAGLVAAPSDAETARAAAPPVSCLLSPVSCPAPVIRETCLQHRITPDGDHLRPRISFPSWRRRRKGQKKCLFEHFS